MSTSPAQRLRRLSGTAQRLITSMARWGSAFTSHLAAVAGWRYTPAVRNGGYVSDWMGLKIEFGQREKATTLTAPTQDQLDACPD